MFFLSHYTLIYSLIDTILYWIKLERFFDSRSILMFKFNFILFLVTVFRTSALHSDRMDLTLVHTVSCNLIPVFQVVESGGRVKGHFFREHCAPKE